MQRRAKVPCKQLNSEAIRGATLCYMSPVIAGQCSIISAKMFLERQRKGTAEIMEFHLQKAGTRVTELFQVSFRKKKSIGLKILCGTNNVLPHSGLQSLTGLH